MFGYCEIGSWIIETAPTSVITIAMTMATMGRLMKNFDIRNDAAVAGIGDPGRFATNANGRGHRPRLQPAADNVRACLTIRWRGRRGGRRPRLRVHDRAFPGFLDALDDDPVPHLNAFLDDPFVVDPAAHFDRLDVHL